MIWISVLEGPQPEVAEPIFVTADPQLVAIVKRRIARRLEGKKGAK